MKVLSRTAKAGFLGLSSASAAIVGLLIASILSRLLTKADYATYSQTFLIFNFAAPLLALGLPVAILYFIPRSLDRARSIIFEILVALSLMSLLFALFFLCGGSGLFASLFNNPALETSLKWFAFYPLFVLPIAIVGPTLLVFNRAPWVPMFTAGSALIRLLVVVIPVILISRDPIYAVRGLLVGSIIVLFPMWWIMNKTLPPGKMSFDFDSLKGMIKYALPLSLSTMIDTVSLSLDNIMVSSFYKPEVFAVFFNGAREIPVIGMVVGSAAAVMLPEISKFYQDGKFEEGVLLFQRSAVKCAAVLFPVAGSLFIFAPELMVILYGQDFETSAQYFRTYLLLTPIRIVSYGVLFQAAGRSDLVLKRAALFLLINVLTTYVFLHWLGPIGAALGTVVAMFLFIAPFCLVSCSKLFHANILNLLPYKKLVINGMIVIVPVVASFFWLDDGLVDHEFYRFLGKSLCILFFVVPLWTPLVKTKILARNRMSS